MELKVDVSRSRCRAFWDRSRLEESPGDGLGPGEPCMALGPSKSELEVRRYSATSLAFPRIFFKSTPWLDHHEDLLRQHWVGELVPASLPGYSGSQIKPSKEVFDPFETQARVYEEGRRSRGHQWDCDIHGWCTLLQYGNRELG